MKLAAVTFLVRDYDEAIAWFTDKLDFEQLEDVELAPGKRWVRVACSDASTSLLLAKADGLNQQAEIGKAAGGRVAFFLHVADFAAKHQTMLAKGVHFREEPRHEKYGTVAVFEDLYGNLWDLIQPKRAD